MRVSVSLYFPNPSLYSNDLERANLSDTIKVFLIM